VERKLVQLHELSRDFYKLLNIFKDLQTLVTLKRKALKLQVVQCSRDNLHC